MEKRTIAVDLGGTHIRTAVSNASLRIDGKLDERTPLERGPDGVIDHVANMVRRSLEASDVDSQNVGCLAIGTPGPLDSRTGVVFSPPNLPGWDNVPLKFELEAMLDIPVSVVNDANAAALGEFYVGSGRGARNLVYITISTGIGGGVIIDGRMLEGTSGTAGEIGHMTIDRRGPRCGCGNVGCLEMIASGTAIARRFSEALAAGEVSVLSGVEDREPPTAGEIAFAARDGDPLSLAIFTDAAEAIGLGVVNCLHLFNPDVVSIGGGVTNAGSLLFDPIHRMVERYTMEVPRRSATVVPAELKDDVGLIGAAAAARAYLQSGSVH